MRFKFRISHGYLHTKTWFDVLNPDAQTVNSYFSSVQSPSSFAVTYLCFYSPEPHGPSYLTETAKKWYCRIIPTPRGLSQSTIQHCQPMARFVYVMIYWIQLFSTDKFIEFLTDGLTGPFMTASWHTSLKCTVSLKKKKNPKKTRLDPLVQHEVKWRFDT